MNLNFIESKLAKVLVFIIANVNVTNENNSVEDIAIMLDKLLYQKIEKDLIDLLKTLNYYITDIDNKSKRILRKIVKKFNEEFIDEEEETVGHMQQTETTQ